MNTAPATAPQKPGKPRMNLTSVTPDSGPVAPPEIDTTTPIDVSVIPFTARDYPKWAPWLLSRLQDHWPAFSHMTFAGILAQHMGTNTSLLIRARKAIVLAVVTREALEPRPVIDIVFCFKHHPDDSQEDKDVRLLFRRVEDWARSHGAHDVRILHPARVDSHFSKAKDALYGDEAKIIVKGLD